jgi:MFS family permease
LLFVVDGVSAIAGGLVLTTLMAWRPVVSLGAGGGSRAAAREQEKDGSVLRDPRAVIFLTGVFLMAVVFYQHEGAMPLFLVRDLHYRESFYGILFAVNTVLIVLLEVPLNLAMQRWSHRWTLVLGATLFAIGFGSMAVLHSVPGLLLAAVVWTFGEMIAMPASGAYAADIAPPGRAGAYAGAYASTFSLAILVGPWAGTIALEALGGFALWSAMLVVGLIGAGVLSLLRDPESAAVVV